MKDNQIKQPKKHPHAEHIVEFARQKASGEREAGWWQWQYQIQSSWRDVAFNSPLFSERGETVYRCIKTKNHPNYDKHEEVRAEWAKVKGKGTHELYFFDEEEPSKGWLQVTVHFPAWFSCCKYEIREIKVEPKLKLIPWDKVPKGVATNFGEFIGVNSLGAAKLVHKNSTGFYFDHRNVEYLRLAPEDEQPWIAAECGSLLAKTASSALDFLDMDVRYVDIAHNQVVAVFKVKGVREGWTDKPELCK